MGTNSDHYESEDPLHKGALGGLRVLDLGRFIAGPFCGMILGDLGADVVHIERPSCGDDSRLLGPGFAPGESYYYLVFNRNKRSLTLNLRTASGQDVLRDLVSNADVLIENFRAGTMEKMGCGWTELSAINPRLIMARASGFGQDGPYAERICTDTIALAMSGLMDLTGDPNGPPTLWGTFAVDYVTGLYALIGILAALQLRNSTGKGQVVDVSLLDSAMSLLLTAIIEYGVSGNVLTRIGNVDRFAAPCDTFRTADGRWVQILVTMDQHFTRFAAMIGREDLISDERYKTLESRVQHRVELEEIVREWVGRFPLEQVISTMAEASILCGPVATVPDVFENPQVRYRGQIVDIAHPTHGTFPMQGITPKLGETPGSIRRPPPLLGADTDEVLKEWLNYGTQDIGRLRAEHVI